MPRRCCDILIGMGDPGTADERTGAGGPHLRGLSARRPAERGGVAHAGGQGRAGHAPARRRLPRGRGRERRARGPRAADGRLRGGGGAVGATPPDGWRCWCSTSAASRARADAGVAAIHVAHPVTDEFALRNQGLPAAASLDRNRRLIEAARADGRRAVGILAASFGCPFEGEVAPARVAEHAQALEAAGLRGGGAGRHDRRRHAAGDPCRAGRGRRDAPGSSSGLHLHNTRNAGYANAVAGLEAGIRRFDASVGGLRRLSVRSPGHRQRRDRGPRLAAGAGGRRARPRHRRACAPPASGSRGSSGGRPRAWCTARGGSRASPTAA